MSFSPKFRRSANIELDSEKPDDLPAFSFAGTSARLLGELLDSIEEKSQEGAWSVIGPYGSGKSLFGVFLAQLAADDPSSWLDETLTSLNVVDPVLAKRLHRLQETNDFDYVVVAVSGTRTSLNTALLAALDRTCQADADNAWVSKSFEGKVARTLQAAYDGLDDSKASAELFVQATQLAQAAGKKGLLVLVDEFGQFLEHAAANENVSNLLVAQYLAEQATRSRGSGLRLLTFLHQSVLYYAEGMTDSQSVEWEKVQGRFREFAFGEVAEAQYGAIQSAVGSTKTSGGIRKRQNFWKKRVLEQIADLPHFDTDSEQRFWEDSAVSFYPLHPMTVFILPRLSGLVGQNQRTLFGFLAGSDPMALAGLMDVRFVGKGALPSVTVDSLFDYFFSGIRPTAIPEEIRRRLSEANAALDRLGDAPSLHSRVIKALAVLTAVERGSQVSPTRSFLAAALDLDKKVTQQELDPVLEQLVARKLIVHRRYADEYRLWQGTDFDIESAIKKATERVTQTFVLNEAIPDHIRPRPVAARRHSFETGNLRAFYWRILSVADLEQEPAELDPRFDGVLSLIAWSRPSERERALKLLENGHDSRTVYAVPKDGINIGATTLAFSAISLIPTLDPLVQDDPVALRELDSRRAYLESLLTGELDSALGIGHALDWYWKGSLLHEGSTAGISAIVSDVCDQLFGSAPKIKNELINRSEVSSTVVVAMKKVISGLLNPEQMERLGLEGAGADVSIFRSLFEDTSLYAEENGQWRLNDPSRRDPATLKPTWTYLRKWAREARRTDMAENSPFPKLFDDLQAPPFGLKFGPALLLVWGFLIIHRDEIALYDNGTYLTEWNVDDFDRFYRHPEFFSAAWLPARGKEGRVLRELYDKVPVVDGSLQIATKITLASFLEKLYVWFKRLPQFTLQTFELPEQAVNLRRVLSSAIDPVELVRDRIPEALGFERGRLSSEIIIPFTETVEILNGAYPSILNWVAEELQKATGWGPTTKQMREGFIALPEPVVNRIKDQTIKAFAVRARDKNLDGVQWIESVSAALAGQSPRYWNDVSKMEFEERLQMFRRELNDAERRSYAATLEGTENWARVIVERGSDTLADVLLTGATDTQLQALGEKIEQLLNESGIRDPKARLALFGDLISKTPLTGPRL